MCADHSASSVRPWQFRVNNRDEQSTKNRVGTSATLRTSTITFACCAIEMYNSVRYGYVRGTNAAPLQQQHDSLTRHRRRVQVSMVTKAPRISSAHFLVRIALTSWLWRLLQPNSRGASFAVSVDPPRT
jgi:hypothetical protein